MTKADIKVLMDEMREGKYYDTDDSPLHGLALDDFPKGKHVRKEAIIKFLNWQCRYIFGNGIDEEALSDHIWLLQHKRVVMI